MSSRIATSVEAQASILVSFLAQANQTLSPFSAVQICSAMYTAKIPKARFLKGALAVQGISLKHTSCLKALALMEGFTGHVSRPKREWLVAHYILDAPATNPKVRNHRKCLGASADLCASLVKEFSKTPEAPLGRVVHSPDFIEFVFIGSPRPGARYILACKNEDGTPSPLTDGEIPRVVERVRRVVEGELKGWLDGAAKIPLNGLLCIIKDGVLLSSGAESTVLATLERDGNSEHSSYSRGELPNVLRHFAFGLLDSNSHAPVPIEDDVVAGLWRRLQAFYRFNQRDLTTFTEGRKNEQVKSDVTRYKINAERLREELSARNISPEQAAGLAALTLEEWESALSQKALPRDALLCLAEGMGLSSANDIYVDPGSPHNFTGVGAGDEAIAWIKRFDQLRMMVLDNVEEVARAEEVVRQLSLEARKPINEIALRKTLAAMEEAGFLLFATVERRFVRDLPINRERLATGALLGIVERKVLEKPPKAPPKDFLSFLDVEGELKWTTAEDERFREFNGTEITMNELLAVQTEAARLALAGAEPGEKTTAIAALRVFDGRRNFAGRAQAASARIAAAYRLVQRGFVREWMAPPNKPFLEPIPRNVLQTAARCPLIRVGNEAMFDTASFRRLALEAIADD